MDRELDRILRERRIEIAREIRNLHDSDLPYQTKDAKMLELDREMEMIEEQIEMVENGEAYWLISGTN